jgi:hypothetical protein
VDTARELGRRAALLYIKRAEAPPVPTAPVVKPTLTAPASGTSTAGGMHTVNNFGTVKPTPGTPAPTAPAPVKPAPVAPAAAPGGGGFLSSLLGNIATPQNLGQVLGALKPIAEPVLGVGGLPLLAAGSNALLHGGEGVKSIFRGPIT